MASASLAKHSVARLSMAALPVTNGAFHVRVGEKGRKSVRVSAQHNSEIAAVASVETPQVVDALNIAEDVTQVGNSEQKPS